MRLLGSARYFRSHLSQKTYISIVSHHRLYRMSISFMRTDVKEKEREREREREREKERRKIRDGNNKSLFLRLLRLRKTEIITALSDYYGRQLFSSSSPFAREERDERKMARSRAPYTYASKHTRGKEFCI